MGKSVIAPQNKREYKGDIIFGANALANEAIEKYGSEKVVCATIGSILDEEEKPVLLKTVENVFRSLPAAELSQYTPIAGLPEFLEAVENEVFHEWRPEAHIRSVGVAGGTGGIHHLVHIYTSPGDEVLTGDWYWGAYSTLCDDRQRTLVTFELFDDNLAFNHESFEKEVRRIADRQKNVVLIMNSPAHNPTGYAISDSEWDRIIAFLKDVVKNGKNNVILGIDVAYLDYAEAGPSVRKVFKKFENLPAEILTIVDYSLSKGFTLYGQRTGGLVCISSDKDIADEFFHACEYSCRSCWSNICRPAMKTMAIICHDQKLYQEYLQERESYNQLVIERAKIFMDEAQACGLPVLPYHGGFFISIPTSHAVEICDELHKDNIFLVPLHKGIRVAACAVPKAKMKGVAAKVKAAYDKFEK